jgi:hypothetical protein
MNFGEYERDGWIWMKDDVLGEIKLRRARPEEIDEQSLNDERFISTKALVRHCFAPRGPGMH